MALSNKIVFTALSCMSTTLLFTVLTQGYKPQEFPPYKTRGRQGGGGRGRKRGGGERGRRRSNNNNNNNSLVSFGECEVTDSLLWKQERGKEAFFLPFYRSHNTGNQIAGWGGAGDRFIEVCS